MIEPHPVPSVCDVPGDPPTQISTYLALVFSRAPSNSFIEVRWRLARGGMGQEYFAVGDITGAGRAIVAHGHTTDVYVGVAPRIRHRGTREDVDRIYAVWADCDAPEALHRLSTFSPIPSIVVGSGRGRHAYWLLGPDGADAASVELVNRRIAEALDADKRVFNRDRILRPPGSLNFKYGEPLPVTLAHCTGEVFTLEDVTASLPHLPEIPRPLPSPIAMRLAADDPLKTISAQIYVPLLTGQEITRDGKVRCPFHEDGTPSLHVYDDGWFCFGCDAGGTIIDFGAQLYGLRPRGADFHRIRTRLATDLLCRSAA